MVVVGAHEKSQHLVHAVLDILGDSGNDSRQEIDFCQ